MESVTCRWHWVAAFGHQNWWIRRPVACNENPNDRQNTRNCLDHTYTQSRDTYEQSPAKLFRPKQTLKLLKLAACVTSRVACCVSRTDPQAALAARTLAGVPLCCERCSYHSCHSTTWHLLGPREKLLPKCWGSCANDSFPKYSILFTGFPCDVAWDSDAHPVTRAILFRLVRKPKALRKKLVQNISEVTVLPRCSCLRLWAGLHNEGFGEQCRTCHWLYESMNTIDSKCLLRGGNSAMWTIVGGFWLCLMHFLVKSAWLKFRSRSHVDLQALQMKSDELLHKHYVPGLQWSGIIGHRDQCRPMKTSVYFKSESALHKEGFTCLSEDMLFMPWCASGLNTYTIFMVFHSSTISDNTKNTVQYKLQS